MAILIEKRLIGNVQRVACIDEKTGIEAVFQAPFYASDTEIKRLAARKIEYILKRKKH